MRIFSLVFSCLMTVLLGTVIEATEHEMWDPEITWEMRPLSEPLTAKQVAFLNLYMQYSSMPQMRKVPKYVKEILPLYIEFHSEELDSYALQYFRVKQLLTAGLSFSEIETLQKTMRELQLGHPLQRNQDEFLMQFIQKNINKLPQLSLLPWIQPLFFHVAQTSQMFSQKTREVLRSAVLKSVGFSSKDMRVLDLLANRSLSSTALKQGEMQALQKWLVLASLHAVIDIYEPGQILRLQALILAHPQHFSHHAVASLDHEVGNSRSVHKFRYANFQASLSQSRDKQR